MEMGKGHKEAADQVKLFDFLYLIIYLLLISLIMNKNG
jgi:hypothetical protein